MPNNKQNNLSLITAAKLGDKNAFTELVKNCYEKLFFFISSRITFEPKEEEDIIQETLVEAYKNISRFKGYSSFFTWLCAIAKQIIQRTQRIHKPYLCRLNDKIAWSGKNPYEVPESNELYSRLHKFINSLSPREREVFRLRFIYRKPYALLAKEKVLSSLLSKRPYIEPTRSGRSSLTKRYWTIMGKPKIRDILLGFTEEFCKGNIPKVSNYEQIFKNKRKQRKLMEDLIAAKIAFLIAHPELDLTEEGESLPKLFTMLKSYRKNR